jgi:hypothetical protein
MKSLLQFLNEDVTLLKPTTKDIERLDRANDDSATRLKHSERFLDRENKPIAMGVDYAGFRKGIYRIVHPGPFISIVQKTHSSKGVLVHQPVLDTMSNRWMRRNRLEY